MNTRGSSFILPRGMNLARLNNVGVRALEQITVGVIGRVKFIEVMGSSRILICYVTEIVLLAISLQKAEVIAVFYTYRAI